MSSNAKAPLPSSLFDDDAPTMQRKRLPEAEEIELELDVDDTHIDDRSRPFLNDLLEEEESATYMSSPPPDA
jgi:hypothetical protein